jgi:GT2 family glycosyltransferase
LLGDDTVPEPSTLATHLETAGGRDIGVQGRIDWDPSTEITEVMRFLAPEGPQFWFRGLTDGNEVPFTAVYGSNLSAPTGWFRAEPFDEHFRDACFEDTEQAYRWARRGWRVVFGEKAVCLHRHRYDTLDPVLRRQRRAGEGVRYAVRKHPGLLWPLIVQPLAVGAIKCLTVGGRALVGRAGFDDRADLRCRGAWLRGLIGGGGPQSSR